MAAPGRCRKHDCAAPKLRISTPKPAKGTVVASLSISTAWDETRATIARDGGLLTTIALAMFVLPGVISDIATPPAPAGQLPKPGLWLALAAIALVIALAGQLAVVRLAIGSRLTVGEAIGHGVRRAPAYFAATLIWVLPLAIVAALLLSRAARNPAGAAPAGLGLLLVGCVGLYFAIRMLVTSPVASAEAVGPVAILKRSWALTAGHWWRLFGFFLIFLVGAVVTVLAVAAVGGVIAQLVFGGVEPLTVGALFVALVVQLVSAAVSVLLMVMLARIYVQLAGDGAAEASVPTSGN
jgi:hypothetical protein